MSTTTEAFNGTDDLSERLRAAADTRTAEILLRRARRRHVRRRGWLVRRALLTADVLGLLAAFALTQLLVGHANAGHFDEAAEFGLFLTSLPIWVIVAKLYGLYDRDEERTDHSTADDLPGVFHMVTVGAWIVFAVAWLSRIAALDIPKVLVFWGFAIVAVFGFRAMARMRCRTAISYLQNTVIVGAGEVGQLVARKFLRHPEYGINLVGFIDSEPKERGDGLGHLALLGGLDDLQRLVRLFDVERVVIAFSNDDHDRMLSLIRELNDIGIQVDVVPRLFEIVGTGVDIHTVEGMPLLGMRALHLSRSSLILKRAMDLIVSIAALLLVAPVLLVVAIVVKVDSRGPVFFRQVRMGSGGRTFRIWKFRTMDVGADGRKHELAHLNRHLAPGGDSRMFKIEDDPRVTRVGRWLRASSLDEFPQLLNVLAGDMSVVGSRPLILEEDVHVEDWRKRRLDLKPGMTGLWQVTGRSRLPFDEMVKLDYLYVTNWSIWNDLRLILRTIPLLSARRGRGF